MSKFCKPCQLRILVTSIPSTRGDILQLARSQIGPTQVIPGCLSIRMVEDIETPGTFIWKETWIAKEILKQRVVSYKFRSILALLDLSSSTPEISISEITDQDGLGWITSVREKQKLST